MSQVSQPTHPTFINISQPPSNPDTPSDMPGTPTSTTTSLSALSTTAIKDGHRGHSQHTGGHRGHHSQASTNSLEAERADRISRLAGLSNLTALRGVPASGAQQNNQTTPSSGQFPAAVAASASQSAGITPAYFDANGQPVASTKISTVGTASATSSGGGRTTTLGDGVDQSMDDVDEDMRSMDTNYRTNYSASLVDGLGSVGNGTGPGGGTPIDRTPGDMIDPMDEDLATRSVGGYDDRMSDDGSASLVGFGEGAGSTVSGPIYQRRPVPGTSSAGAMAFARWQLERTASNISETSMAGGGAASTTATAGSISTPNARLDTVRQVMAPDGSGGDTPVSASAAQERRDARMVDGVATDGAGRVGIAPGDDDDVFVDTTTRSPVPISAARETVLREQIPRTASPSSREAAERIVQRLDEGESNSGAVLGSAGADGERLGQFYFEKK